MEEKMRTRKGSDSKSNLHTAEHKERDKSRHKPEAIERKAHVLEGADRVTNQKTDMEQANEGHSLPGERKGG
jgi:hypothetical protein